MRTLETLISANFRFAFDLTVPPEIRSLVESSFLVRFFGETNQNGQITDDLAVVGEPVDPEVFT